jgi:glycosyltransferase involved in cell wall biosynthesis
VRASVVIPCFNSLKYLPETLSTVLGQTFDDFEVVLVDDGGSDNLTEWAATFPNGNGDPRVRVVRQENAGVSAARNLGVTSAQGEVVVFCDSDDLWAPTLVAELVGALERNPAAGLAYGWYDLIDGDGTPTGRVVRSEWEGDVWEQFVTRNPVSASAVAVPKAVLDDVGLFLVNRDRFPIDVEDWELWIRIAGRYPVVVVREVLAHHRRHDANSSSNVESLAAAYTHLLAAVFDEETPVRQRLRPSATARTELLLAWHFLNDRHEPAAALDHLKVAKVHDPDVRRSTEYWRIAAAATALRATGDRGYAWLRSANRGARRVLSALPLHKLRRESTYSP